MKTAQPCTLGGLEAAADGKSLKQAMPWRPRARRACFPLLATLTLLLPWMLRPADAVTTVSSNISSNTTWTTDGDGIYEIAADITVISGVTLTINPGVTVRFQQYRGIWVDGTLNATGLSGSPITFTGTSATKGWWRGIHVVNSGSATFSYADLSYAGYWEGVTIAKSGSGSLSLTHSTVQNSSDRGLVVSGGYSSFLSANNQFSYHNGRACHLGINASFDDTTSTFSNNGGADVYLDGGFMSANTTWNLNPAYSLHVSADITVATGVTLTVKAGTVVKFAQYRVIWVDGTLNATGTAQGPVHFTDWRDDTVGGDANKDAADTSPGAGWWRTIKVQGSGSGSLDWSVISYAGYWDSVALWKTGDGNFSVTNTTVRNTAGYGIYISGSSGINTVTDATSTANSASGMYINSSAVTVDGSHFTNNGNYGLLHEINDTIVYPDNDFSGNTSGSVGINGGTINKDITWTRDIDIEIRADVTVQEACTLTIQPGVTVRFALYKGLWVNGNLNAVGEVGSPISFTGTAANRGHWRGIHVTNAGNATISRADLSYAGYWERVTIAKSGSGSLSITDSKIRESSARGLVVSEGYSSFASANNVFSDNSAEACHLGINASFDDTTSTFSNNVGADVYLDGGTMTVNTTWNLNPAYSLHVSGDITVALGATLTVKPGTVVKMGVYRGIWVDGTLHASGTAESRIHFTDWRDDSVGGDANKDGDDTTPGPGWWKMIKIQNAGTATLDWCILSYTGYWDSVGLWKTGSGDLTVSNTTVRNGSGYGFYISNNSGVNTFTRITATANSLSGMYINNSACSVTGSVFSNNGEYGLLHEINDTIIYPDNYFTGNTSGSVAVQGNTMTKDMTWTRGIDMVIRNDMTVQEGCTLTIEPGVTVRFAVYKGLWVNGNLHAVGTPEAPISFTGTTLSKGWWRGVHVINGGNATISHANMAYAGYWENTTISKSGTGSLSLTHTTIRDSGSRGLVVSAGYSSFLSAYNQFSNNNGQGCNIGINASFDDATSHFAGNGGADVHLDGGVITADTVWNLNPAYSLYMSGDMTVGAGVTLSIQPGTVVKMPYYRGIWVDGILNAKGTSGSPIHFTDWRDDTVGGDANNDGADSAPTAGSWRIISVRGSGQADLESCTLAYAGYWERNCIYKQGDGNLTLRNCTIRNTDGDGLLIDASTGVHTIERTVFSTNGNGVRVANQTQALSIAACRLEGNTSYGVLNSSAGITVDARSNWWGAATGPQHTSNPDGTGDRVSDGVLFDPWRRVPSAATILSPVRSGTLVAGDSLRFTGAGEPGALYAWNFGDGRTSTAVNPGVMSFSTLGSTQVTFGTRTAGVMDPFPDERQLTVVTDTGSLPDLRTTQLVLPDSLKIGQAAAIHYAVSNVGDGTASGTWKDAVYLSKDAWLDAGDAELGSTTATRSIAAGESYQGEIMALIPVVEEGTHFLIVSVDDTWQVVDRRRMNNEKPGSASVLIPGLTAGDTNSGTLPGRYLGEGHHFRVDMAEPGNLRLRVTGNVTIYVSTAGLAGSRNFTWQGSSAQDLLLSGVPAGPVFIQVVNNSTNTSTSYTLLAELADLVLAKVSPSQIAASADTTLSVDGLGFRPGVNVTLVRGATRIPAVSNSVQVFSNQRLTADFPGTSITQGLYDLEVSGNGLTTATLADAVTVVAAAQPKLTLNLVTPSQLGYHGLGTIYVDYANEGNAPMRAPMILLTPKQSGLKGAILTLDGNIVGQGFWSSTLAAGFSTSIQLLGSGEVAGMLMPGERRRVPVYYAGWLQPWNFSYPAFDFQLRAILADDARPLPLAGNAQLVDHLRPDGLNDAAWTMVRASLLQRLGTTLGQFITRMGENASYLQNVGERTDDIGTLITFEVNKARGAFHPVSVLSMSTDLEAGVPGEIPFLFGRWFSHDIGARHAVGALGTGWSHPWEYQLRKLADNTLVVSEPGGRRSIFHPDQRGGYIAVAGSLQRMQAVSGGYQLTGATGDKLKFDTSGFLVSMTGRLGHVVTLTYTNGILAGLSHSSGATITFTHANNRIVSATDHYGRTVQYTYDAAGLMTSCTDANGGQTTYTYNATHAALSAVTDPGGRTRKFTYDARHQLQKATDGAGALVATTATYTVNGAQVTIKDGLDRTFSLAYDHKGMIRVSSDPYGRQGLTGYDHASRLTSLLDEQGFGVRYQRDSRGNVTRVYESTGASTSFTYDSKNRLTSRTDGVGRRYEFSYDGSGNVTRMRGPDGKAWEWTYGDNGLPATFKDRTGTTESYTWNSQGQLVATTDGGGATLAQYVYDSEDRISRMSTGSETVDLTYNAQDRITKVTMDDGRELTFGYDTQGRRTFMANQTGHRVNYHYDALGRLSRITDGADATVVEYTYDATGQLSRKTLGNGVYTVYESDAYGRITGQHTYQADDTVISSLSLVYDRTGRLKTHTSGQGTWQMEYDPSARLVKRSYTATGDPVPEREETFTYDDAGQLATRTYNGTSYDIVRDSWGRILHDGERSFSYDAEGRLVSRNGPGGVVNYTMDAEGRMTSATAASGTTNFHYDAMGVIESSGQTGSPNLQWQVDPMGSGPLCALDDGGSVVEALYQGVGMAARDVSGSRYFPEYDPVTGTQLFETNASGAVVTTGTSEPPVSPAGMAPMKELPVEQSTPVGYTGGVPFGNFGMDPMYTFGPNEVEMAITGGKAIWNHPTTQGALDLSGKAVRDPLVSLGVNLVSIAIDTENHNFLMKGATWTNNNLGKWVRITGIQEHGRIVETMANSKFLKVVGTGANVFGLVSGAVEVYDGVVNGKDGCESATKITHGIGSAALAVAGIAAGTAAGAAAAPLVAAVGVGLFIAEKANEAGLVYYVVGGTLERFWTWWDEIEPVQQNARGNSVGSMDPNEMIGPAGYGTANFRGLDSPFGYRIDFENDPEALAPAQIVTITHTVNNKLDRSSFQLTSLGFGDTVIPVETNDGNFFTTVDLLQGELDLAVEIDASYDHASGRLVVRFTTIDKATGLPPSVEYGFLPAEDGTGCGKGFVAYSATPSPSLKTGAEIRSVATINFDFSYDIQTNQVDPHDPAKGTDPNKEALVTIDATAPVAKVTALPLAVKPTFPVAWSGNDGTIGSGIANYTVYVSDNGGTTWKTWLTNTPLKTAQYKGIAGKRYRFNVIARDRVGNVQALNAANATAATTVIGTSMISVLEPDGTPIPAKTGTVAFGKVTTGTTLRKTLTIRNRGPLTLSQLGATLTGTNPTAFKVEGLAVKSLASGAKTTFTIVYQPQDAKAHTAILRIASNDIYQPKYDIILTGTGTLPLKPEITVQQGTGAGSNLTDNKSTRDFGIVRVGKTSAEMIFTIKNTGTAPLKNLKVTLSGLQALDFKVVRAPSTSVSPGKSTQFRVVYKPGKPILSRALLKIASNDADENPFRVKLTGEGKK